MKIPDRSFLASKIDHSALKADTTPAQIEKLCEQALSYGFASVCVNSVYVPLAVRLIKNGGVKICTVVGFPLGAMSAAAKSYEASCAVADGAREIDMVIPVGLLKSGDDRAVFDDISAVVSASKGFAVKVILETCLLSDAEKVRACALAREAGAVFVKTSTGFSSGGATVADVALLKQASGLLVKASGGIRTLNDALKMLDAGADRIGASASVEIIESIEV